MSDTPPTRTLIVHRADGTREEYPHQGLILPPSYIKLWHGGRMTAIHESLVPRLELPECDAETFVSLD